MRQEIYIETDNKSAILNLTWSRETADDVIALLVKQSLSTLTFISNTQPQPQTNYNPYLAWSNIRCIEFYGWNCEGEKENNKEVQNLAINVQFGPLRCRREAWLFPGSGGRTSCAPLMSDSYPSCRKKVKWTAMYNGWKKGNRLIRC